MIMAVVLKEDVIRDIEVHFKIDDKEIDSSAIYVGITNDVNNDLFSGHGVSVENDWWIYRTAESQEVAEEILQYFKSKGYHIDAIKSLVDAQTVFAFKMTDETNPSLHL